MTMSSDRQPQQPTIEQAQQSLQATPSYIQRYQVSVEIEGKEPLFRNIIFCLSCGFPVESEQHQCNGRRTA